MSTLQNLRLQSLASIIIIFQLLLIQKDLKLTWTKILHFLPNKNVPGISKTEFLKKDNFKQECLAIPHSNHLSSSDFLRACEHRSMWLNYQKEISTNASVKNFFTESQKSYFNELQQTGRMRKFDRIGSEHERFKRQKPPENFDKKTSKTRRKSIRKEIRMMTDEERANFFKAANVLKTKFIDNISIWDLHTILHYPNSAVSAHWGPSFLPWHREFLRQFELTLQKEVPELIGLPYWDETLDSALPDPSDSVLWTDELLGNGNGFVKEGPFKDWTANVYMPLSPVPIKKLFRSTGSQSQDRLLSDSDVEWVLSRNNFSELTFCHDKTFESMHGLSHAWVGGFMVVIRVSPNDPIFYLHHTFIDHLWEQFRQKQQTPKQRIRDYATKICDEGHGYNAQMLPFNIKNKDGLSEDYLDLWYDIEPVPTCNQERPYCHNIFLFCDRTVWKCRSRVQLGGNCTGYTDTDICYKSTCIQNVCRIPAFEGNGYARRESRANNIVWTKALMLDTDNQPMNSGIAHVNIVNEATNQTSTAFMLRNPQYPELPGMVYLPLPYARDDFTSSIFLDARDHYGRYCQSYCFNITLQKYEVCEPIIELTDQINRSSKISFTHQFMARKFLDMDLSTHPSTWMIFACHRKMVSTNSVLNIGELIVSPMERSEYVWFRVSLLKKTESSRSLDDLQIESEDLDDSSDIWISSLSKARSAYDHSMVFVRAKNPRISHQPVRVRVVVRDSGIMMDCDVQCNKKTDAELCDSTVILHEDPNQSQEQVFASDPSYLPYLGWRMTGHPSQWHLEIPYLSFFC